MPGVKTGQDDVARQIPARKGGSGTARRILSYPSPAKSSTARTRRPQPRIKEGQWLLTMAKKPPDRRQPSLFPPDPATPAEPDDNATSNIDGEHYAVQDDGPRTPATTAGDSQPAPQGTQAAADDGAIREGAEGQPRGVDGASGPDTAGQRQDSTLFGSTGTRPQGAGGSFALRVRPGGERPPVPRRSYALHPQASHAARVKASRQRSLFD